MKKILRQFWLKKIVSKGDWKDYYSHYNSFSFLSEDKGGIWLGFTIFNYNVPANCLEMDNKELYQVSEHRKAYNTYPNPLK